MQDRRGGGTSVSPSVENKYHRSWGGTAKCVKAYNSLIAISLPIGSFLGEVGVSTPSLPGLKR